MTNQQIIDNNKLIAEFMEAKPNLYTLRKDGSRNYFYGIHVGNIYEKAIKPKGMPFYTDWNWLMPIVEKIEQTEINKFGSGCQVTIMNNSCSILSSLSGINILLRVDKTRIKATYKAVVEFIKWYNKEGK